MERKVILITGANSGIGFETSKILAGQGHSIIMVARSQAKGYEAQQKVIRETGNINIHLHIADLSSQDEIRALAYRVKQEYSKLDVLINNAGGVFGTYEVSEDGFEMTFAVNYLAPFLLSYLLLDLLKASESGKIINVASIMQDKKFNPEMLTQQNSANYSAMDTYKTVKTAVLLMTYNMSEKLKESGVSVNALHPGFIYTPQATRMVPHLLKPVMKIFSETPEKGAELPAYLAVSKDNENVTGKFFKDKEETKTVPISYDKDIQNTLDMKSRRWADLDSQ